MSYVNPAWLEHQRTLQRADAYRFAPPGSPEAKPPGWLDPSATRVRLKEAQEEEARRVPRPSRKSSSARCWRCAGWSRARTNSFCATFDRNTAPISRACRRVAPRAGNGRAEPMAQQAIVSKSNKIERASRPLPISSRGMIWTDCKLLPMIRPFAHKSMKRGTLQIRKAGNRRNMGSGLYEIKVPGNCLPARLQPRVL